MTSSPYKPPQKQGFTLVELLVVIAIIGILVSLLLPAVQSARESARRVQCTNNLKQLALGCISHEATHKYFPSGGWNWTWSADPDFGYDRRQPGGWCYNILPYMEQQALHDLGIGKTAAAKRPDLVKAAGIAVSAFYCPSRRIATIYTSTHGTNNAGNLGDSARTDYAANTGTNTNARNCWWYDSNDNPPSGTDPGTTSNNPNYPYPELRGDGVIYSISTLAAGRIRDGLSNTYLIGEKYLNPDHYENGADAADNNPIWSGMDWDWHRWAMNGPLRDRKGVTDTLSFGSAHGAGVLMAFCDGSVRPISYTIDKTTHSNLCSRADGQAVSAGSY